MNRLDAAFLFAMALLATDVAAQPMPSNIRDGCSSGSVEPSATVDVDLFTVPEGMDFVLTDFAYETPGAVGNGPRLVSEAGESRWVVMGNGTGTRSWATGIKYTSGKVVRARMGGNCCNPYPYLICWTGYLSPSATSSVDGGETGRVGFRIGPNPTGAGATLWFRLERDGPIKLAIYDTQGRILRVLKSGPARAGEQSVRWDGRDRNGNDVSPGLYYARLETPTEGRTGKIIRLN